MGRDGRRKHKIRAVAVADKLEKKIEKGREETG